MWKNRRIKSTWLFYKQLSDFEMVDENGASCVKSHSLGIRIQKKILGKMASRSVARHFIDDDAGKILDALYAFLKVSALSMNIFEL